VQVLEDGRIAVSAVFNVILLLDNNGTTATTAYKGYL